VNDRPPAGRKQTDMKQLSVQIAARMRALRQLRDMTLIQIARPCGTTPQTIQRLETNNMTISVDWVACIADALNVPVRLLTDDTIGFDAERIEQQALALAKASGRAQPGEELNWRAQLDRVLKQLLE